MSRYSLAVVLAAGSVFAASAVAGPRPVAGHGRAARPGGGTDSPGFITLSNNIPGDGSLVVKPDTYGAVTFGFGPVGNEDIYDPAGATGPNSPTFGTATFLYSGGVDRVGLYDTPLHGASFEVYYSAATVTKTITTPLAGSDSDGDAVIDTATSTVSLTGGAGSFNLSVQINQRVYKPAPGSSVARFRQRYTITNNAAVPATFKFSKHVDMDLYYTNATSFGDVAGTVANVGGINPYEREPSPEPATTPFAFALVPATPGYVYCAGRLGIDPYGAGPDPALGYGTDVQIWNAYGLPPSWENYTAGIGTAPVVGELPDEMPPGTIAPFDGWMDAQWNVTIPAGGNTTFEFTTVYGSRSYCYANCDSSTNAPCLNVSDFGCFLNAFAAGHPYANCDDSTNAPVLNVQDFGCFLNKFAAGCGTNC
jgi:hypothetical protein